MLHNNSKIGALMNMTLGSITLEMLHPPYSMFCPVGAERPVVETIYQRK